MGFLGAAFAISTGPALACTCAAPATASEALQRSTVAFRGKVSEISRPFWDRVGITNTGSHHIKLTVVKQWKGRESKSVVVVTKLTGEACGFPFQQNEEYLVYVVSEPKDIQTGICTGTKSIVDAAQEMKQLDEIVAGKKS